VSDGKTTAVVFKTGPGPGERREPGGVRKVMADQMIMEDEDEDNEKDEEGGENEDDDDQDEDRDFDDDDDDDEDQGEDAESRSVRVHSSPRPSGDSRSGSIGSDQAHRRAELTGRIDEEDEYEETPSLDAHRDVNHSRLHAAGGSMTYSDQDDVDDDDDEEEEEDEDEDGEEEEDEDESGEEDDDDENGANVNGTASGYEEDSEAGTSSEDDIDYMKRQIGYRAGMVKTLGRSPRPTKFRGSQGRLEKMQDDDEDDKETTFTSPRGRRGMYQVRRGKLVMQEREAE
jgi:hypothetical protein